MLIGLAFVAFLLTIPLARGRIGQLGEVRPRAGWLLALGLGTQIVIISVLPASTRPPILSPTLWSRRSSCATCTCRTCG
jgi:hypothetical protein